MLKSILSSQKFKSGLKKLTTDGDIIHSHGLWRMPHIYSLSVKKRKNIKIVNSPKGSFAKEALSVSRYKKILFNIFSNQNKMLSNCDAFHATSLKEKDEIRSLGYKQPIAVIPEGIDIPKEKKTNFTREKAKIKSFNCFLVGFVFVTQVTACYIVINFLLHQRPPGTIHNCLA